MKACTIRRRRYVPTKHIHGKQSATALTLAAQVVLSVGGATETPTSAAYFTTNEPVALANKVAALVKASKIDGVSKIVQTFGVTVSQLFPRSPPDLIIT